MLMGLRSSVKQTEIEKEEEIVMHFLCQCPALAQGRRATLGSLRAGR